MRVWANSPDTWNPDALQRSTDAVIALLLSLRKKPLIRYGKESLVAKKLATEVRYRITQEEQLFEFRKPDTPPILLILDRRDDPITPLLTQWTYQAMVHEQLGIVNGRVDMSNVPDIRSELKEILISQDQDPFFKKNMYMNFGDLGGSIKEYVDQYQTRTKSNANIESIEDMRRFVEDFPEFRKLSGNVSKHVALVSELSRQVANQHLLDVSELEQSLACSDHHASDVKVAGQDFASTCARAELIADPPKTAAGGFCLFKQQTSPRRLVRLALRKASVLLASGLTRSFVDRRRTCAPDSPRFEATSIPTLLANLALRWRLHRYVRVGISL